MSDDMDGEEEARVHVPGDEAGIPAALLARCALTGGTHRDFSSQRVHAVLLVISQPKSCSDHGRIDINILFEQYCIFCVHLSFAIFIWNIAV